MASVGTDAAALIALRDALRPFSGAAREFVSEPL
jgi:hypothetical protein